MKFYHRLMFLILVSFLICLGESRATELDRVAPSAGSSTHPSGPRQYRDQTFLQGCPLRLTEDVRADESGTVSWTKRIASPNAKCKSSSANEALEQNVSALALESFIKNRPGLSTKDHLQVSACAQQAKVSNERYRVRAIGDYYYKFSKVQASQQQMLQLVPVYDMLLGEKTNVPKDKCEDPLIPQTQRWCQSINQCDTRTQDTGAAAFEDMTKTLFDRYKTKKALAKELEKVNSALAELRTVPRGDSPRVPRAEVIQNADPEKKKQLEAAMAAIDAEDPWLAQTTLLSKKCRQLGCDDNLAAFKGALRDQLKEDRRKIIEDELPKARTAAECIRSASGRTSGENNVGRKSSATCKGSEIETYIDELPSPDLSAYFEDVTPGSSPDARLAKHYFTERYSCISEQRNKISDENRKWSQRGKVALIFVASVSMPYTMAALATTYHGASAVSTCRNPMQKMVGSSTALGSRAAPEVTCPKPDDRPTSATRSDYDECISHLKDGAIELVGVGAGALVKTLKGAMAADDIASIASRFPTRRVEEARLAMEANEALGVRLSQSQKDALYEAHIIGRGTHARGTYTTAQIAQKNRILANAGFSKEQRRILIERGIAGDDPALLEAIRKGTVQIVRDPVVTPRTEYTALRRVVRKSEKTNQSGQHFGDTHRIESRSNEFYEVLEIKSKSGITSIKQGDRIEMRIQHSLPDGSKGEWTYDVKWDQFVDGNGIKPDVFVFRGHPDGTIRMIKDEDRLIYQMTRFTDGEIVDITNRVRTIEPVP